jgi:protein SCO1/2
MKWLAIIIVCCIGISCSEKQASVLPYYTTADFTPHWIEKGSAAYDSIHTIPAFSFIDQDSNCITEKTIANKIYIADFFFTSCPGICPRLTKNLRLVQDAFKNDSNVLLLSHSVTPDIDNVATLKKYAQHYGVINTKWHLLTGNKDSIYTIARKGYFADEDLGLQRTPSDFLHTENMLLIDKKRRIRGIYKGTSVADIINMEADIKLLEQETDE